MKNAFERAKPSMPSKKLNVFTEKRRKEKANIKIKISIELKYRSL